MCLGVTYLIAKLPWSIEEYLRGYQALVERWMAHTAIARRNHIGLDCERFSA